MTSENTTPNLAKEPGAGRTLTLCAIIIVLLASNLFFLQPWLAASGREMAANFVYLAVRVVGFVTLAYFLTRWAGRNRFQALSSVMVVGAIDQVLFKFISMKMMLRENPGLAGPEPLADSTLFYGLATGFLFFAPILLILGFLGVELNRLRKDWKGSAPQV